MSLELLDLDYSSAEIRDVKRVQFGILSPEVTKAMSVCEVAQPVLMQDGVPKEGGLMDLRMGTTMRGFNCASCGGDSVQCPGHFGHIELAKPVFHTGFLTASYKVLQCICFSCSSLLCDKTSDEFTRAAMIKDPRDRLGAIVQLCKKAKTCGKGPDIQQTEDGAEAKINRGCGAVQPHFRKLPGIKIEMEHSKSKGGEQPHGSASQDRKRNLTAEEAHNVFKRISDEDCRILGFVTAFARPDWMIITVLPVSPPPVRPTVMMDATRTAQDDITHKLRDILQTNGQIKRMEERGVPAHVIADQVELLQYHVNTMIDNEINGQPQSKQRTGKVLKSLRQRLVGKGGRVRGNLMGKRCDFSARTVIGGDPHLSIDQVGVPQSIARNLTFPERVTHFNKHILQQAVENGPDIHPGAKTIIRDDGRRIDLRMVKRTSDQNLEVGYIVERHLVDGDVVLFNRQPSLHKMSIMAHHVRILPFSTFRLNLTVTSPYNADFDGDEMNLHVPQSHEARSEALNLMRVPLQIVSPQANRPVMGIVQDSLLGITKFTRRDTFLEKHTVFNLLMWLDDTWDGKIPVPAILKPKPLWTGKQIFSLILPKVNVQRFSNGRPDSEKGWMSETDTRVRIEQGELLCGIVDKRTVGTSGGSLIHVIWNECGPEVCKHFLNELQHIVTYWLLHHSSSIGVGDTIANARTKAQITNTITSARKDVTRLINQARTGGLKRQPGSTLVQTFEAKVNEALNKATNTAGKAVKNALKKMNNIKQMVEAGSKGNAINISQIIACVGQQNVQGKRIAYGFIDRTLPHFKKGDLGPESRGFVSNSYLQGLTPEELFFHAMGGREGLVDTAVKTASTGYIQRRLVKSMEGVTTHYDGTVRNSLGQMIQFLYGEDGLDGVHIEKQRMVHAEMSDREFYRKYRFDAINDNLMDNAGDQFLTEEVREQLTNHEVQIKLRQELLQLEEDRRFFRKSIWPLLGNESSLYLPVNIERLMWNAQKVFSIDIHNSKFSSLNPAEIVDSVRKLGEELVMVPGDDDLSVAANDNATKLFKIILRAYLAAKPVCRDYKLTKQAFYWLLGEIKSRFTKAFVHPCEAVGTIAAQSIGEPATQMTLNTFHFAGVSAKNVTLGVPRLAELINVAKTNKTPSLTIYLQPEVACDMERAKIALNKIELTRLKHIVAKTEIYYDPDPQNSVVQQDREFLEYFFEIPDEDLLNFRDNCSPWMLRIVLDRKKKEDKRLSNPEIADQINQLFEGDIRVLFSNDNAEELVLQVRLVGPQYARGGEEDEEAFADDGEDKFLIQVEERLLNDVVLCGIEGIKKVFMRKEKRGQWDKYGKYNTEDEQWVLDTEGGMNLLHVLALDEVDPTRTISSYIVEIFEVLGIEGARKALLDEIRRVISFDGSYVNYRHLSLLVDTMTFQGYLMPITRHGVNRQPTGPIKRCSFEETVEILMEAAHFSMPDDLLGISENILMGKLGCVGSGAFDLILDDQMLEDAVEMHADDPLRRLHAFDGPATPVYQGFETPSMSPGAGGYSPFTGAFSPVDAGAASPMSFSPIHTSDSDSTSELSGSDPTSPHYSPTSPNYSPTSPNYSPTSPNYSPTSPSYSPTSPSYSPTSPSYSPTSPSYSPTSPSYSPTSPSYSPTSPSYSPTSPSYSPTSPSYSPTSPSYSPTSPSYSPTSPSYSPTSPSYSPTSPSYSPTSPSYSPTSPSYSPTSPSYSPTSPSYSPTSPSYSPTSPSYSPTSPSYSPTSPSYSPTSPSYSPTSPSYSPTSPSYSPTSPSYSPTSPSYSPTSPSYSPTSPSYSPTSPSYSPTSPSYSPTSPSYSPTSPSYSPTSPSYSPTSPSYSPTSPSYSPTSPNTTDGEKTSPTSPSYSPTSPSYSPTSPSYSPTSPDYSPTSPSYSPTSPSSTSPTSPNYSPTSPDGAKVSPVSPDYSPTSPNYDSTTTSPDYSPTSPNSSSLYSTTSPTQSTDVTSSPGSPTSPSSHTASPSSPSSGSPYGGSSSSMASPSSPLSSPSYASQDEFASSSTSDDPSRQSLEEFTSTTRSEQSDTGESTGHSDGDGTSQSESEIDTFTSNSF